jgi:hypothetical protein
MQPSTFDVKERRKRIIVFKVGKLWLFKQFFEDKEIYSKFGFLVFSGVVAHRRKYFILTLFIFC